MHLPTLLPLAAAAAALAGLPTAAASAASPVGFTASAIDAPADRAQIALVPTTQLEVRGTVAGASDAGGILLCTYATADQPIDAVVLDSDVPVKGGAFATTVSATLLPLRRPCRLRVVPLGITSSQYGSFTGPRVVALEADRDYAAPDLGSHFTVTGAAQCGVADLGLSDVGGDEPLTGPETFGCAAHFRPWADAPWAVPDGRSEIRVDGTDAFLRALTPMTRQRDVSTGDVRWSESHEVVRCTHPVFPLDGAHAAECGPLVPTGVRFERSGVAEQGGTVTSVRDVWSSTDGAAHDLDLLHQFDLDSGVDGGVWFPWMSDWFERYTVDQPVRGPGQPGPGSFFARPDGSELGVLGPMTAISYGDAPDRIEWSFEGAMLLPGPSGPAELAYVRKVAADEPYRQAFVLSTSASPQAAQWMAVEAEDRLSPPQLSISTPVEGGSVPSDKVEITGDARDTHGIASLTVNGVPATRDGELWRVQLTPPDGPLTVVARAVDGDGNVAVARRSFTVTPPAAAPAAPAPAPAAPAVPAGSDGPAWIPTPPSPRCVVPKLRGLTLARARTALRAAHCRTGRIQGRGRKLPRVARVVRQSPRAGTSAPEAAEVALDIRLRRSR